MPLNLSSRSSVVPLALALALLPSRLARAQDAQAPAAGKSAADSSRAECARAYEQGQEQRNSGQLLAARADLQVCAQDQCADFIRADCVTWYGEVQSEVPTVVFAVRGGGRDLTDVRISIGERRLVSR